MMVARARARARARAGCCISGHWLEGAASRAAARCAVRGVSQRNHGRGIYMRAHWWRVKVIFFVYAGTYMSSFLDRRATGAFEVGHVASFFSRFLRCQMFSLFVLAVGACRTYSSLQLSKTNNVYLSIYLPGLLRCPSRVGPLRPRFRDARLTTYRLTAVIGVSYPHSSTAPPLRTRGSSSV